VLQPADLFNLFVIQKKKYWLRNLTANQRIEEFAHFHRTKISIKITKISHSSLSWPRWKYSTFSYFISPWLSSAFSAHLCLGLKSGLSISLAVIKFYMHFSSVSHHVLIPLDFISPNNVCWRLQCMDLLIVRYFILHPPSFFHHHKSDLLLRTLLSDTHKVCSSLLERDKVSRQNKTTNRTTSSVYFNLRALRMRRRNIVKKY
jgi:hypothetical protein